jgi:hypothetical protein
MWRKTWLLVVVSLGIMGFAGLHVAQAAADTSSSSGNIVVQTVPSDKLSNRFVARAKSSWPWYIARASGLVAGASLILLLLSGIGQITGHTFRLLDPLTAWASHRALGIAFGVSVLVHIVSLLFDHFVQFSVWQVLVPWVSNYRPVTLWGLHLGSLYVALGVLALYVVTTIIITSLLWVEKKPQTWKLIHLFSYVAIALVFVHGLFIGTDLAHGMLRWAWIVLNSFVLLAALARLKRAGTI